MQEPPWSEAGHDHHDTRDTDSASSTRSDDEDAQDDEEKLEKEYFKRQRRRHGFEDYSELERYHVGSALQRRFNLYPEVDAKYLAGLMPSQKPVGEDVLDLLEERCLRAMIRTAATTEKKRECDECSCTVCIPEIIKGFPRVDPKKVIKPLLARLKQRKGVTAVAVVKPEVFQIKIYWSVKSNSSKKATH